MCDRCSGETGFMEQYEFSFRIPALTPKGSKLRFRHQGNDPISFFYSEPGDLVVLVQDEGDTRSPPQHITPHSPPHITPHNSTTTTTTGQGKGVYRREGMHLHRRIRISVMHAISAPIIRLRLPFTKHYFSKSRHSSFSSSFEQQGQHQQQEDINDDVVVDDDDKKPMTATDYASIRFRIPCVIHPETTLVVEGAGLVPNSNLYLTFELMFPDHPLKTPFTITACGDDDDLHEVVDVTFPQHRIKLQQ